MAPRDCEAPSRIEGGKLSNERHEEVELAKNFLDVDYRQAWADDFVDTTLALQIAVLRRARQWSQTDLANRASTKQSAISRMEDVEYGAHSIRTLKQLAAAFGLRLRVSFEEFGDLIRESAALSENRLNRNSFEEDTYVSELLASEGLTLAPVSNRTKDAPAPVADEQEALSIGTVDFHPFISFREEFDRVLLFSVGDRVVSLQRWLKGYGLPSEDEPAYKALYYSIPADDTHGDLAKRLGEACAQLLLPEGFAELLSDREDGSPAAINLLRLSIALRAAVNEIVASCEELFQWLEAEWKTLDESVQEAVIDLASELGLVGEIILNWHREAALTDRHRFILATNLILFQSAAAARILEEFVSKERSGPMVFQTADKVIQTSADPTFRGQELMMSAAEKAAIAIAYLNILIRNTLSRSPVRMPAGLGYHSVRR